MMDWNDLRYFLAVAREGSTLRASRALHTSQTTVARRIAALEESVGVTLFDKRQAGYVITPAGEELLARAQLVESSAQGFYDAASARARDTGGAVKLSMEEIFATSLIAPWLRDLHELHPEIHIELDTSAGIRDLGAGEADVALRSTSKPQPAGTVGRRICDDDWTFYCSREYAEKRGVPGTVDELGDHPLIGGGGGNLSRHYEAYLEALGLLNKVIMRPDTSTGLLTAVRAGVGVAVLPCIVAENDPSFIRCLKPRNDHGRVLWLVTHERVRKTPKVRSVIDFLYARLKARVLEIDSVRANAA
ncbi:MAG TPA: LysR family transcriptional regulator [Sphingomicrobium sp.]